MLDRDKLRKPGATGLTMTLADGQEWLVRRPRTLFVPDDNEDGIRAGWDLGPEYDALYDRLIAADNRFDEIRAVMAMARFLLCLNYDLGTEDLKRLLRLDFRRAAEGEAETDSARLTREIEEVVVGEVPPPKATAAGSVSP